MEYTFHIDGRTIDLNYEVDIDGTFRDEINKVILETCCSFDIAKMFNHINFVINISPNGGHFDSTTGIIYLDYESIEKKDRNKRASWIMDVVLHELTHFWHLSMEGTYRKIIVSLNKQKQLIEKKESQNPQKNTLLFRFQHFFYALYLEGIAMYSERALQEKLSFDKGELTRLYNEAADKSSWINTMLQGGFEKERGVINDDIVSKSFNPYKIGLHMVYCILYVDNTIDIEFVMRMKFIDFVKKYEDCMNKAKLRPLISMSSGKGDIDYKRSLKLIKTSRII